MGRNELIGATGHFIDGFTFATRHPRSVFLLGTAARALSNGGTRRRRRSQTANNTLRGLGAAAVAVPIGIWLGRRIFGGGEERSAPQVM